jgi:hypothetical protein
VRAVRRLIAILFLLVACDDLKDFRGTYSGQIIGGEFVRSCFRYDTNLTLRFDPNLAVVRDDVPNALPNILSTEDGAGEKTFDETPLEPLRNLVQDPLGELDFPGPQRLRNYILLARPQTGKLAGRDALVVVSLLASESVEVRILVRSGDDMMECPADFEPVDGGADEEPRLARREWFGLWRMRKK